MNLHTKEEVRQQIGNKPLFRKMPKTAAVLSYVSGINELTFERNSGKSEGRFFIAQYPQGLLISARKGKFRLGIAYADLKNIEITKREEDYYEIAFSNSQYFKPVIFSFQKKNRLSVLSIVKSTPVNGNTDTRDSNSAREEILKLKEEFAKDFFTNRTFREQLKGTTGSNRILEIDEKRITYKDRVVNASEASGYAISIERLSHNGIARFEYSVRIYHPEKDLYINFTSVAVFEKQGEHTALLNRIGVILFDVISRPIVAKWFDQFANGETVDSKEFTLSRHGMLLKTRTPHIMIHWDEIAAQSTEIFRWPYSNTVFLRIDSSYDRRGYMLFYLVKWLQKDPERLTALMGRNYYVS